ncbi:Rho GTPase-activating protein 6 [Merluccius polli]|uniref:Rho GTPase-activating protein 6 n=1 Tax=Merluccius polli TaxID=89951 RepID=A0AA47MR70_MERPO|nr:Rho GTPase-activating protein 6 [Merluccius polli]
MCVCVCVCVCLQGDFTWNSMSGRSVGLQPVPLQSLSELERVRLQDVAFSRLQQDYDLGCQITLPKAGQKRKKSLRRKLDSLSKEKSKDKDNLPQAFGIPLAAVIANDRAYKQRLDSGQQPPEGERDGEEGRKNGEEESQSRDTSGDSMFSFLHVGSSSKRPNRELSSSNSSLSSTCETPTEPAPPSIPDAVQRIHRRGGVSVDCISDLDDNQSRLLEALQLSLLVEAPSNRKKHRDKKLSLNPIYQQVPRVIDCCCQHLEKNGLQTVGIFRVGSSKKRVKQLREEFDQAGEVLLDEEQSVHDVAALLKEFLRDMPDPLLTRELYTAFINSMLLDNSDQVSALQLLIYLLPPCNSDTLQRLLHFLFTVAAHADDRLASDGAEVTGNKMTALNLATIFGPNLLHKQKNSDKEFAVQSFARAEESSTIIAVVQSMISNYQTLFMVPCDLQNEVLMRVLETDTDVVDYLLRRKDSQYSSPSLLRPAAAADDDAYPLSDRRSSGESPREEDSSGEVSPYDNNSPVLSDRPARRCQEGGASPPSDGIFDPASGCYSAPGAKCKKGRADARTSPFAGEEAPDEHFWGDWHTLLSKGLQDTHFTGSHGDASECESRGSLEGLHRRRGNGLPAVKRTQSALGVASDRTHLPLTRCSSGPSDRRGRGQAESPLHHRPRGQSGAASSEDLAARTDTPAGRCRLKDDEAMDGAPLPRFPGALKDGHISNSAPSLSTSVPPADQSAVAPPEAPPHSASPPPKPPLTPGPDMGLATPESQEERWHVWQLLSPDSAAADTLPESLV